MDTREAPNLGKFIICFQCGKRHRIKYGKEVLKDGTRIPSKLLAFYSCQGSNYVVAINGEDVRLK